MKIVAVLVIVVSILQGVASAQQRKQPKYTPKHFVNYFDTTEFKIVYSKSGTGPISTYILVGMEFYDTDDADTTAVMGGGNCLINIRGFEKNKKKEGIFTTYLIDSADHSKRYKVYEQTYKNDKLNGEWRIYNLKGTLVMMATYRDDSLEGIRREYWIDGKTIMSETEHFRGTARIIDRAYWPSGKLKHETSVLHDKMDGLAKEYYEDGSLKREAMFVNGSMNGMFKYYYPGGKLWIEQVFKDDKPWEVRGNYDQSGKPREKGTLKNGNGTVYLYNEDGTVREIETYINGVLKE